MLCDNRTKQKILVSKGDDSFVLFSFSPAKTQVSPRRLIRSISI